MPQITFPAAGRDIPAYLAVPAAPGPWPGVVVVHEIFGLTAEIRAMADQCARGGYLALAPDLFEGQHWVTCVRAAMSQLQKGRGPAFDLLDDARTALAGRAECTGRTGIIGFCMGGGFAVLCAPRDGFDVAAANYGIVPEDAEQRLAGACPVVGSYGGRDQMGTKPPERLARALTVLEVPHDVEVYPGSGHRFMTPDRGTGILAKVSRTSFQQADAEDAWRRIFAFFGRYLTDAGPARSSGGS